MTYNVQDLLESLESGLSSPTAQSLRDAVMEGDKDFAFKLIRTEVDFDDEACDLLYGHLSKMLRGHDINFVEIPKEQWAAAAEDFAIKNAQMDYQNPETFMVRYGTMVFQTKPFHRGGDVIVYNVPGNRTVDWLGLDQIWRMLPK